MHSMKGSNLPLRFSPYTRCLSSVLIILFAFFFGVHYVNVAGTDSVLSRAASPSRVDVRLPEWEQTVRNSAANMRKDLEANVSSDPVAGNDVIEDAHLDQNLEQVTWVEEEEEEGEEGTGDEEDGEEDLLEDFQIQWGTLENYQLLEVLGEGEYAEVYRSIDLRTNQSCVAKMLKPVDKYRVKREIKILQDLAGGPNIVRLLEVARNSTRGSSSLVTEYVNATHYRPMYTTWNDTEVRFYMFQLLRAVEYAHGLDIMHRDIKPHNIMIDPHHQKLRLIDWGLSDYYDPDYSYTSSVGSRFWRAPEHLVGYGRYHLSSDIWAVGCIIAAIVFGKEPFFRGRNNDANQLVKIAQVLGTDELFKWMDKYEIKLDAEYDDIHGWYRKQEWSSLVSWQWRHLVNGHVLDLLSKMLVIDHNERMTATEALAHAYFDPVREAALSDPNTVTVPLYEL